MDLIVVANMVVGSLSILLWLAVVLRSGYTIEGFITPPKIYLVTIMMIYLSAYYFFLAVYMFIDLAFTFTRPIIVLCMRYDC